MRRLSLAFFFVLVACSSSSSSSTGDGGSSSCPDLSGTYKITAHCDASLVGKSAVVTETKCALSFAAPFDGFTGTVSADGKITLSGPQSCTGTAAATSLSMNCTPGTCQVTLTK